MAEINYNNLYNQLKPMEQRYYDQQFSKKYDPNKENIMLTSQPAYEQMKSVYEAQQQVPEVGFFDSIFGSASAAEPPSVPNLSYQNITPTFNLGTGITNTKAASPFINVSDILNQYNVPDLQNQNLVNQLIQENQMKANVLSRPNMMNIAGDIVPSGITTVAPLQNLGIDTSYGVANTPNVVGQQSGVDVYEADDGTPYYIEPSTGKAIVAPDTVEAYKRQSGYYKKEPSGIAKLFEFLGNIPTPMNILRGGIQSLQGLNKKIRGTTFALSPTLKDYVQAKRAEKRAAAGADVGVSGGGRGSRRGDADIAGRDRGGFATDDTAGFF